MVLYDLMWLRNKSGPKAPSVRGVTDGFEKGIFRPSDPKFVRGINTVRIYPRKEYASLILKKL